jgi:hypothetical protein
MPEDKFMEYMRAMHETYKQMPEDDKQRLHAFEGEHLGDGVTATSDWPGWEKYIGIPPWKQRRDS